jgi:hypothetical protein
VLLFIMSELGVLLSAEELALAPEGGVYETHIVSYPSVCTKQTHIYVVHRIPDVKRDTVNGQNDERQQNEWGMHIQLNAIKDG